MVQPLPLFLSGLILLNLSVPNYGTYGAKNTSYQP
jgi:hypothetical protein